MALFWKTWFALMRPPPPPCRPAFPIALGWKTAFLNACAESACESCTGMYTPKKSPHSANCGLCVASLRPALVPGSNVLWP